MSDTSYITPSDAARLTAKSDYLDSWVTLADDKIREATTQGERYVCLDSDGMSWTVARELAKHYRARGFEAQDNKQLGHYVGISWGTADNGQQEDAVFKKVSVWWILAAILFVIIMVMVASN